jgi:serine/threonine protein kinase
MPLRAGDRLGPYEILSPLGSGGMGEVYRARDTRLGREVALKVLHAEVAQDPARRQRFEHEARAASALNHPNIVSTYDVGAEGGTAFIVSELVEGATLRESIRGGPVPVRKLLDIATQMADGMAAAHATGFLHRDLKPENIMLTSEGRVKILDFGLAKAIARSIGQDEETVTIGSTSSGAILGTVAYMSPEQASAVSVLDGRSDQFSFGLILYEMAAGKKAFERPTAVEIMTAIIRDEPASLPADLPAPIRWTVERCLSKEPAQRYESTRDLYLELLHMRQHHCAAGAVQVNTWSAAPCARGDAGRRMLCGRVGCRRDAQSGLRTGATLHAVRHRARYQNHAGMVAEGRPDSLFRRGRRHLPDLHP